MPRPVGRPVDSPPEDFRRWYLHPETTAEARAFARGQIFEWDRTIAERNGEEPEPRKRRTKNGGALCDCGHSRASHDKDGCGLIGCICNGFKPAQPEIPLREPGA